jgi:hypothetical protein
MNKNELLIEVSIGEVVDKYTILQIKRNRIRDEIKLKNIKMEFEYLKDIVFNVLKISKEELDNLLKINNLLWDIEDSIRIKDKNMEFDNEFIELAKNVYRYNDARFEIKNRINLLYGSRFIEVKSYEKYS